MPNSSPESSSDETPKRDPSKRLTAEDAQKILRDFLGEERARSFEIPKNLPPESEELPALIDSSDQTAKLPEGTDDDMGSQDELEYLLEDE